MNRRSFLTTVSAALAATVLPTHGAEPPAQPQPDILVFITDQQHAGMMSCAGNAWLKTPAMDRIAQGGVRCLRTVCTNPVCIPSRFSLATGRMPSAIGMDSNITKHIEAIPAGFLADGLGHLLRRAGYRPVWVGKQHFPKSKAEDYGFEVASLDERMEGARTAAALLAEPRREPLALFVSLINPHDICAMAIRDFAETEWEKMIVSKSAAELACVDAALAQAAAIPEDEFWATRCPPLPPNHAIPADEPEAVPLRCAQSPFRVKARAQWDERRWRMHRWVYARLTEQVDAEIGVVLDALDAQPARAANTLVVMTSDHGDLDAARKLEHKSLPYQESVGVPLLLRFPGRIPAGSVVADAHICNGTDLVPTLCDYAGARPPADLPGRSLRPLVEGSDPAWRPHLVTECETGPIVFRGDLKYIAFTKLGTPCERLYDLRCDPYEMHDLSTDPAHAADLAALRTLASR